MCNVASNVFSVNSAAVRAFHLVIFSAVSPLDVSLPLTAKIGQLKMLAAPTAIGSDRTPSPKTATMSFMSHMQTGDEYCLGHNRRVAEALDPFRLVAVALRGFAQQIIAVDGAQLDRKRLQRHAADACARRLAEYIVDELDRRRSSAENAEQPRLGPNRPGETVGSVAAVRVSYEDERAIRTLHEGIGHELLMQCLDVTVKIGNLVIWRLVMMVKDDGVLEPSCAAHPVWASLETCRPQESLQRYIMPRRLAHQRPTLRAVHSQPPLQMQRSGGLRAPTL